MMQERRLETSEVINIFVSICTHLQSEHDRGVTHPDLKPANIVIAKGPGAAVNATIDNGGGGSMLPQSSAVAYMSPEQCRGQKLDPRSDIYSLGCILFEALTGKAPYDGNDSQDVTHHHMSTPVPPLASAGKRQYPKDLEIVVKRAVAKLPLSRYQSMREFAEELGKVKRGKAKAAKKKSPVALIAVIVLLALAALAAAYFLMPHHK
jgi:serine/threonine-protein kinase